MFDSYAPGGGDIVVLLADGCTEVVLGRVDPTTDPVVVFETVARLHLAARRRSYAVRIITDDPRLVALFDLVGLAQLVTLR